MANSTQEAVSDGTLVLLDISIDYLDRTEITVYFDSVLTTSWSWVGITDKQIAFSPAVPIGTVVLVRRTTEITQIRHEFSLGAAFTAQSLDEDLNQVLHIAQEAKESNLSGEFYGNIDMHSFRITHLAAGVDPDDVPTLSQLQPFATAAAASAAAAAVSADEAAASALEAATYTVAAHLATTVDAHAASAISIVDAGGNFTSTDVEGALAELQPKDTTLTALAAMPDARGAELAALTAFIGGLLNDADAAAARATLGITLTPAGTIIDFAGTVAPTGYLACPLVATNISRTTYANLFAAIGTTWGAGDGSTTFGMPWFPADYASVQANANVGSATVGAVISHFHTGGGFDVNGTYNATTGNGADAGVTDSTGGPANLAAGQRILKCVKI